MTAFQSSLLFAGSQNAPSWWLRDARWEEALLDPPITLAKPAPVPGDTSRPQTPSRWDDRRVIAVHDDAHYTVNDFHDPSWLPVLTKWRDGKPEIIARAEWRRPEGSEIATGVVFCKTFNGEELFVTPDGSIWSAAERLARLSHGRWQQYPNPAPGPVRATYFGCEIRAINQHGPPWFLAPESLPGHLWRLDHSPDFKQAKLSPVFTNVKVRNALSLDDHRILVIDSDGNLHLVDTDHSTLTAWRDPLPGGTVSHAIRDGTGRLWLAGDSVWLQVAEGKPWQSLSALQIITGQVTAIAADPDHRDGVVVVTHNNEVAFIRASIRDAIGPARTR